MKDKIKLINLQIYEKSKEIKNLKRDIKNLHEEKNMIQGYIKLEKDIQKRKNLKK